MKKVVSPPDPAKNIEYIIKEVNSKTRKDILRWININEDILEEDLKLIGMNLQIYIINLNDILWIIYIEFY